MNHLIKAVGRHPLLLNSEFIPSWLDCSADASWRDALYRSAPAVFGPDTIACVKPLS